MLKRTEDVEKALGVTTINGIEIRPYQPRDARQAALEMTRKAPSNLFVKNFNPAWTHEKIKEVFSRYGEISNSGVLMRKCPKDKVERPIAFISYQKDGDALYGPEAAKKAIEDLHNTEVEGHTLYVQLAIPLVQRQA